MKIDRNRMKFLFLFNETERKCDWIVTTNEIPSGFQNPLIDGRMAMETAFKFFSSQVMYHFLGYHNLIINEIYWYT